MGQPILGSAGRDGESPPCCSTTATHVLMHSSQIYTDGPATSRPTSSAARPQNEQRSFDCLRSNRTMAASFCPMLLYPRFAPAYSKAGLNSRIGHPGPAPRLKSPSAVLGQRRDRRPARRHVWPAALFSSSSSLRRSSRETCFSVTVASSTRKSTTFSSKIGARIVATAAGFFR
jgi:hypothetical protein